MNIRLATLGDRPIFMQLWAEHMTEQEKDGSSLKATVHNLHKMLEFFEYYSDGKDYGMVYIAESAGQPVGICMSGAMLSLDDWDTTFGKLATLWGVYVVPSHRGQGIGIKLFASTLERGLELGFDTVETYVRVENEHGNRVSKAFGTKPYLEQHIARLRDPDVLNNDEARKALAREVCDG
jgi:ribosomal protein S18 acetylase RimI-like enzyme